MMVHKQVLSRTRPSIKRAVNISESCQSLQLIASFNFFIGNTLTVFDAGLALKTHGSFVNGLTPFLAGFAGFFFSFMLSIPPSLKEPFFFNSDAATAMMASLALFTSLLFNPACSATVAYAPDAVTAPLFDFMAFMAFIAFIAFMAFIAFIAFIAFMAFMAFMAFIAFIAFMGSISAKNLEAE